jgi:hypothetical protein
MPIADTAIHRFNAIFQSNKKFHALIYESMTPIRHVVKTHYNIWAFEQGGLNRFHMVMRLGKPINTLLRRVITGVQSLNTSKSSSNRQF